MAASGHFGFHALARVAQTSQRGGGAYFVINTLKYHNQPSNFGSRRLVTESLILTLLIIADKGGVPIWTKDVIEVDLGNEKVEEINWSLHQYILLSRVKYPSKTKLYCVKKGITGLLS